MQLKSLLHVLLFLFISSLTYSQQSAGSITGSVRMESPKAEERPIVITLIEASEHLPVQSVALNVDGTFVFQNVAFATYDLKVQNSRELFVTKRVVVNSVVPIHVVIDSLRQLQTVSMLVSGSSSFDQSTAASHTVMTAKAIESLPVISSVKKIESVILNTPGAVPDEDGRMHMRGEDAQLQYVIDGIPITGNMTRVYSSLLNANIIKSVDIQTGNFSAEYGIANAAILSVTSKSGFDKPLIARASSSFGTFNAKEGDVELGGMLSQNAALYGAAAFSSSDRYLDPIASSQPYHSFGKNSSFFGKGDFNLSSSVELHLLGGFNNTDFEIPNFKTGSMQDQKQNMNDYTAGVNIRYHSSDQSVWSALAYRRYAKTRFTSNGLTQLTTTADYAQAVANNEKMFIGAERINENNGAQLDYTSSRNWFSIPQVFKAGISGELFPIKEFFTFAVTNPEVSDTAKNGDPRYKPYDITQAGRPFLVNQSKRGNRIGAFVQDQFQFNEHWTFSAGLRFDRYSLLNNETGFSPRLAASYRVNESLILRASYNLLFMQVPVENVLVSSSDEAKQLTGQGNETPNVVKSERSHVVEIGAAYHLNNNVDFELVGYTKFISNFIVKVELGNSGIIFPANIKNGLVAGGEFRVRLHEWNNLSGSLSVSTCASLGLKPDDGSSPFGAGLVLGEEGYFYSHPFAGESSFNTEHNQLITAVLNLAYNHPDGYFGTLSGRFDSGLPFDLLNKAGVGPDETESRQILKDRGYSDEVINLLSLSSDKPGSPDKALAPRVVFDLGIGYDFNYVTSLPLRISANVLNVFDTAFLYKFESSFGGTHFGYPRMVAVKAILAMDN